MKNTKISSKLTIFANQQIKEREYWLKQLSGDWIKSCFPYDYEKNNEQFCAATNKQRAVEKVKFLLTGDLFTSIIKLSRGVDYAIHTIITSIIVLLLHNYTGSEDILLGTPIYKQEMDAEFINTVLVIRIQLKNTMTFKELLGQVKQGIFDASQHQNYPMDIVVDQLGRLESNENNFDSPLFDVSVLLTNIHDPKYLQHTSHNVAFLFEKKEHSLEGFIEYNPLRYGKNYIEGLITHFTNVFHQVLSNVNEKIFKIDMLSETEKRQFLFEFNDTQATYPKDKVIHELFARQVEKVPQNIAACTPIDLSDIYEQLNQNPDPESGENMVIYCFKQNPYVCRIPLRIPGEKVSLQILKTYRHNSVIINNQMESLLALFDGNKNIKSIYSQVKAIEKAKGVTLEFLIYSMESTDLLEMAFKFKQQPEKYIISEIIDLVKLVGCLYRNHLIELVGVNAEEPVTANPIIWDNEDDEFIRPDISLENLLLIDKKLFRKNLLLLGDTPGTATSGLLYLASYLRRKGIESFCQFYDPTRDYISMKENIENLLRSIQPTIVAISLKWFLYIARVIDMCQIIKEYARKNSLDIKVVVGGNTASYYCQELIQYDSIDILVRGDGEEPLLKICQGEELANIPNCIYRKNGKIFENPVIYTQDVSNSKDIYLSHLEEILLSNYASYFGTFFIYTHKGCTMNCLYCGGCNKAQQKSFNRKYILRRRVEEIRKDIIEAQKYTSTFHFEFDILEKNLADYCRKIWEGINLSGHFCLFNTLTLPSNELVDLVSRTFKYVYWDFDICTPSERHRKQLEMLGLVKPLPSDAEIIDFFTKCEKYKNIEVRPNLINGLPYFTSEDIAPGEKLLSKIMSTFSCFGELHWARLHAQPGAPIIQEAAKYNMYSYATTFEDFLEYSKKNAKRNSNYSTVENFNYPYIYFKDDQLNSRITYFYFETNKKSAQFTRDKKRDLIISNTLTYRQLEVKVGQLANALKAKGGKPGDIVGLMLKPSNYIPIGILGILKIGCIYMPIDPEFPGERIKYMLKDANAAALVTTHDLIDKSNMIINWDGERILLDVPSMAAVPSLTQRNHPHQLPVPSTSLAYIIYTSGSTGRPKGTLINHQNLVNFMYWFTGKVQMTERDKAILTSSFAFDLSHTSIFPPLLTGGELHLLPRDIYLSPDKLLDYIYRKEITYIKVTPSLLKIILNSSSFTSRKCRFLRLAIVAGEPIDLKDIEAVFSIYSHLEIMNSYGPTETTVACATHNIMSDNFSEYKKMPVIGKPIANATIYILNRDLMLMPMGVPGELCVSGAGVGRGYLNQPELTAEKFCLRQPGDSFRENAQGPPLTPCKSFLLNHSPMYRTGDLARWLPDGTICFLGRIDNQVKIRGYRIELGEIEKRLKAHPRVEDAVVLLKEARVQDNSPGNDDKSLCAYIVSKSEKSASNPQTAIEKKILTSKEILGTNGQPEVKTTSILSLFQTQVKTNGEKVAVKSGERTLTYYSLDRLADRVAGKIIEEYDDRYKLSKKERIRYKRQMLLHGWGMAFQEKLKSTTVFVAGAGGGASPTIMQLALMGIGTIKICDFDEVELSNLNRQFLHDVERIGMNKAQSAQVILNRINPEVTIIPIKERLTRDNVFEMVGNAEIIFDMMDGPADKFTLSECAVSKRIPHVIIAMADLNGFATVLHTPHTPCYHCLFSKDKLNAITSGMKNVQDNYSKNPLAVVSAPLFMSSGTVVNEVIKILMGVDEPAYNKFFYFNQRGSNENLKFSPSYKSMTHLFSDHFLKLCKKQGFDWDIGWRGRNMEELEIAPDPNCPVCGIIEGEKNAKTLSSLPDVNRVGKEMESSMQTVGILLDMGTDMAPAHIGLLKAGKTPVLLNPSTPPERLCYILEDSEARIILTNGHLLPLAEKIRDTVNKSIKIINLERIDKANQGDENLNIDINPNPTTCIIYTPDSDTPIIRFYNVLLHGTGGFTFENPGNQMKPNSLYSELTDYLKEALPTYMLPSYFVKMDKIPLTPNGKVDFKALPKVEPEENEKERVLPGDEAEEKLVSIWADVLGIEAGKIGIEHNFFELGGNSLSLVTMISKIYAEFGQEVPISQIFQKPFINEIAKLIWAKNFEENPVVLLNKANPQKIFCFPPQIGYGFFYLPLARIINNISFYAFSFIDDLEPEARLKKYADIIIDIQPVGPYILYGYSMAGKLTFQVAKALENRGREVSDIIYFDCTFFENSTPREFVREELEEIYQYLDDMVKNLQVTSLKEKAMEKTLKYMNYHEHITTLEKIDANVHLVLSEEIQNKKHLNLNCWKPLTSGNNIIYNGFGGHRDMFKGGYVEKNAEVLREILDKIIPY